MMKNKYLIKFSNPNSILFYSLSTTYEKWDGLKITDRYYQIGFDLFNTGLGLDSRRKKQKQSRLRTKARAKPKKKKKHDERKVLTTIPSD